MSQKKQTLGAIELSKEQLRASKPIPLYQVLEDECRLMAEWPEADDVPHRDYLARTREAQAASAIYEEARARCGTPEGDSVCLAALELKKDAEIRCLDPLNTILHRAGRSALCLSGGGIRSATFALGVLQGLARLEVLDKFDYLSTVSGGGYIGSWLSAWVERAGDISIVSKMLAAEPLETIDPEPAPIRHLRAYSNYLDPQTGLLSADTWTLAATVLRNIFLNWLILIPAIAFVLLLPRLCLSVIVAPMPVEWRRRLGFAALGVAAILFVTAFRYLPLELPAFGDRRSGPKRFLIDSLAPLLAAAALFTTGFAWLQQVPGYTPYLWQFILFGAAAHLAGWISSGKASVASLVATGLTGVLGGALGFAIFAKALPAASAAPTLYVTFAFPLILAIVGVLGSLLIGLSSKYTEDEDREWWARSGAWVMIAGVMWLGAAFVGIHGPIWLMQSKPWVQKAVSALGGVTGVVAILLGKNMQTSSGKETSAAPASPLPEWILKSATPIFTVLLLAAIGTGAEWMRIECLSGQVWGMYPEWQIERAPWFQLLAMLGACAALSAIASSYVNVNIFSLHAMYRDRLIRAYVGASRESGDRKPNLFTGQDPDDNVQMYQLKQQPFHVLNIALNLVKGTNLAWQQRKAESFTVSPMHWGSYRIGYRPSDQVLEEEPGKVKRIWRNISLGTAAAISGAAASPNMGYQSSPLLTFLMTMFNARLGWWLGNPSMGGKTTWYQRGPRFALKPLVAELLGLTNDESAYVNLSDGGHFENLALYEMVLRRCHHIVVVDSGCDPEYKFEDLGNAIRKIRIDLGISIEFSSIDIGPYAQQRLTKSKGDHYATGRIRYSCVDPNAPDGRILYIKPALNGNEPRDVLHYAAKDPSFPQQPTLTDQSYDESQFESYRRLGHHTIEELAHFQEKPMQLAQLFSTAAAAAAE